jgi:hypothetical protein
MLRYRSLAIKAGATVHGRVWPGQFRGGAGGIAAAVDVGPVQSTGINIQVVQIDRDPRQKWTVDSGSPLYRNGIRAKGSLTALVGLLNDANWRRVDVWR